MVEIFWDGFDKYAAVNALTPNSTMGDEWTSLPTSNVGVATLSAPVFGGAKIPGVGSALGIGQGAGGQVAQTSALTANTTAITSLTAALTGHGAVVTANTTATTAGTAATTGNTASQTSNVVGNTVQTSTNTAAIAANTAAVSSESATSGGGGLFSSLMAFLPAFDVGSSNVPHDMMAQIHKGEIIVPAAQASNIRSGQSMLGNGGSRGMALPDGAADNMRAAGSNEAPASVGGNTYNSRSSGDVNLHYSPSINAHSNVNLDTVLAQQGSAMRRWLANQARNGSLKSQH